MGAWAIRARRFDGSADVAGNFFHGGADWFTSGLSFPDRQKARVYLSAILKRGDFYPAGGTDHSRPLRINNSTPDWRAQS